MQLAHLPKPNGFSCCCCSSPVDVNEDVLALLAEAEAAVEAVEARVAGGRLAGLSSALRSEKLSEVLIRLERLSKLTDPLIT